MNLADRLQMRANNFSNFEDFENYTGYGDDMLDFAGNATSFASMFQPHNNDSRTFTINVTVASTFLGQGIQLFGDLWSGAEQTGYSALVGTLDTGITAAGAPKSISKLYSWLQHQPTVLQGFQLVCSNAAVINSIISTHETSPFRDLATDPINLSAFKNEYQFQSDMITVDKINKVISNQTYWLLQTPAPASGSYTITINLYFGTALNNSTALQSKMVKAAKGITNIGGVNVAKKLTGEDVQKLVTSNNVLAAATATPIASNKRALLQTGVQVVK